MSKHGPLFDEFNAQSGEHHGGAVYDEFGERRPSANAGSDKVTQSYRDVTAGTGKHGARWDEFGWQKITPPHGNHFDSDFTQPAALDGRTGHGTWMDVFRGGAQTRAIVDGKDVEAVVISCHPDHAVLELRRPRHADGGGRVEVGLDQLRELRYATQQGQASETRKPAASPGNTPTPAVAAQEYSGANGGARVAESADVATGSVFTNKTHVPDDGLDVQKMAMADFHTHSCSTCKAPYHVTPRGTVHSIKSATHGGTLIGKAVTSCQGKSCSRPLTTTSGKPATRGEGLVRALVKKSIDATVMDLRKLAGLED